MSESEASEEATHRCLNEKSGAYPSRMVSINECFLRKPVCVCPYDVASV